MDSITNSATQHEQTPLEENLLEVVTESPELDATVEGEEDDSASDKIDEDDDELLFGTLLDPSQPEPSPVIPEIVVKEDDTPRLPLLSDPEQARMTTTSEVTNATVHVVANELINAIRQGHPLSEEDVSWLAFPDKLTEEEISRLRELGLFGPLQIRDEPGASSEYQDPEVSANPASAVPSEAEGERMSTTSDPARAICGRKPQVRMHSYPRMSLTSDPARATCGQKPQVRMDSHPRMSTTSDPARATCGQKPQVRMHSHPRMSTTSDQAGVRMSTTSEVKKKARVYRRDLPPCLDPIELCKIIRRGETDYKKWPGPFLLGTAQEGNVDEFKMLVERCGLNPRFHGDVCLIEAARHLHYDLVRYLLSLGLNPRAWNSVAWETEDKKMLEILREGEANYSKPVLQQATAELPVLQQATAVEPASDSAQ